MKLCRFPPLNWKCERKPVILQCPTLCSEGIFTANSSPFFGEFHHPWPPSFSSRKTSSCLPDGPEYLAHQIGTASLGSYTAPPQKKKHGFLSSLFCHVMMDLKSLSSKQGTSAGSIQGTFPTGWSCGSGLHAIQRSWGPRAK